MRRKYFGLTDFEANFKEFRECFVFIEEKKFDCLELDLTPNETSEELTMMDKVSSLHLGQPIS